MLEQTMERIQVDVAVIGAGTAGLNARREVERRGGRALLIESTAYGTTCARVGCMPSKLLIAAAEAAHAIDAAPAFGVHAGKPRITGAEVMQRVRRERDRFVGFVVADTEKIDAGQRRFGKARFIAPTRLAIDDRITVDARAVVVAAGSTPFVPPPFDAIRAHVLTSDEVFELPDLPASLAVIGAGIIALELGQAMHRLGVRTAFFSPFDDLGPFTDPEVSRIVRRDLGAELDLRTGVRMLDAQPVPGGVRLRWQPASGDEQQETFERVLVAAGRRPSVEGLGLEATGLALGAGGLPAIDVQTMQCGDAPIFFAGDVNGHLPLLHEAADEGRIAGANAMLWPAVERHDRRVPLAIAFTDPQMAMVGLRHADLAPERHAVAAVSFDNQGRARVAGRNRGLVRLYGEIGSCRLVGAEMFGPGMEHMAHLLAWAAQQRMSVPAMLTMPFYHPVLEEGLRTGLRQLARELRAQGSCRPEDLADAPGD
jgi:dihydrolipoamide dehydrogenase